MLLFADYNKQPHRLCLLVYYIPENFEPTLQPHGNSKSDKPFYGTLPSTMESIAVKSSSGPKEIISDVSAAVGGVMGATDPCCLPRNEQQVTDVRRRRKRSAYGGCNPNDELAIVMQKAYVEDVENCFIREMKTLREPAVIVARDRQLNDMVKFCTNENCFGIVTVDPTFCLGDFDVTITTYRHLVLQCRRSSEPPVFIGPAMVHYNKTFSTYLFFASSLVGLRPDLSKLRCFGTDGEEALSGAFKQASPKAVHLLCSLHFRWNIKYKLKELRVAKNTQEIVLSDIFGSQQVEGLIDSEDEKEFELGFDILATKWKKLDSQGDQSLNSFSRWFYQYKSALVKSSMLKSIRRKGGLGDPPLQFTTNASESVNFVLKSKVDYRKNELPEFLDKLKSVIDEQERELERAIIGRGKYKLCDDFKRLEISEDEWFTKMSVSQREAHVKRVLSVSLEPKITSPRMSLLAAKKVPEHRIETSKPSCSQKAPTLQTTTKVDLCVDVSSFCDTVLIPKAVLCAIWNKATELLNEPGSICKSPGGNAKDRIVKSTSGSRPHLISFKKGGQYACDSDCPNWKSLGVCSHSVAAAQDNNDLSAYVEWLKKAKRSPNLTKLVTTTMPKGRGQKGGGYAPPRKRKKKDDVQGRKSFTQILNESVVSDKPSQSSREDVETSGISGGALGVDLNKSSFHLSSGPISSSAASSTSAQNNWSALQGGGVSYIHTENGNTSLTITGATATSTFQLPQEPPPLVPYDSVTPLAQSIFELAFVTGNISVCRGCRQRYQKPVTAPMDLCIRHKEWQEFLDPTGKCQQRFGNVYYHANVPCIQVRWPNFNSSWVHVSDVVIPRLTEVHIDYLTKHLPELQFD